MLRVWDSEIGDTVHLCPQGAQTGPQSHHCRIPAGAEGSTGLWVLRRGALRPFFLEGFPWGHHLQPRGEGCGRVSQGEENIAGYYRPKKQLEPQNRDQALLDVFGKLQGVNEEGGQVGRCPEWRPLCAEGKGGPEWAESALCTEDNRRSFAASRMLMGTGN